MWNISWQLRYARIVRISGSGWIMARDMKEASSIWMEFWSHRESAITRRFAKISDSDQGEAAERLPPIHKIGAQNTGHLSGKKPLVN